MQTAKKRAYVVEGYNLTLEEIAQNSNVEVVEGKSKKLHLKMGENTGITNAEKMTDKLICFIPDPNSCQYLIMSEIMDVFLLKPQKLLIGVSEGFDEFTLDEWDVEQFVREANKNEADSINRAVFEYCFASDPDVVTKETQADIKPDSPNESGMQTHIMLKGEPITLNEIQSRTTISVIRSLDNSFCLQYRANTGITKLNDLNRPLKYITSEGPNDITEMVEELSKEFQLELIEILVPIIASPDEYQIDEKFFNTYGKAAIEHTQKDRAIFLLKTYFQQCDDPEFIPIPIELLSDDSEK